MEGEGGREGCVLQGQISRFGGHMAREKGKQKVSAVHNLHICALNGALGGHLQLWRRRSHMRLISDIGNIDYELSI